MAHRIEVESKVKDGRALSFLTKIKSFGFTAKSAKVIDVYTIDKKIIKDDIGKIIDILRNPVTENAYIDKEVDIEGFNWAIEIGYLPGVTDNVSKTVKEEIEELVGERFKEEEDVYSSFLILLEGDFTEEEIKEVALTSYNPLIQRVNIKSKNDYLTNRGMGIEIPIVRLEDSEDVIDVNLDVSDDELIRIGKQGILDPDGTRRGPLALDLASMKAIKNYYLKVGRVPKDIEIESIAQTWSEHCKHTIFASSFDDLKDGLYKGYIKKATEEIRKKKGNDDICVSVFSDNSGAIEFDNEHLITDKVETHNSPSALDPFGGAITGIVGVNRDTIGFGMGAKPVINRYGYCFADPKDERPLYKGDNFTQKMLTPRKIMEGVIDGVNVGGNCSGIPTPQGFAYFNEQYRGKPLVFVGTIGLIPRKTGKRDNAEKSAVPGDYVVMVGGKVGADGVHGATFSSEAMDSGSPATAVQIGDPITQKKLSDAIVKEARDRKLYNSITDNGAGGISCSVAEMAKECGGCNVDLEKVPLKYPGLKPWEIWISESQERMTLSVPKDKWKEFKGLMDKRGVEATIIGEYNSSGKCVVNWHGKSVMDIDMDFLHDGVPEKIIESTYTKKKHKEPQKDNSNLGKTLNEMLKRLNITSFEFISNQYDHEVQGGSVLKPLQGEGRVNSTATVTRPKLNSKKGVVLSQALHPSYSDIDTYHMAACSIDTAIRNVIAVGGSLSSLALLDNFCWCSSDEPERLGQLKEAVRACYEYATKYETPFISGKDSMFNDFSGYDENNNKTKISVPPTLLISSIGVVKDVNKTIDLAFKKPNDLIYIIGDTKKEMGGSEYYAHLGYVGNSIPKVDAKKAIDIYTKFEKATSKGLLASSFSIVDGGLGVAFAKKSIAGQLGAEINISSLKEFTKENDEILFSESQSRFVVSIDPKNKEEFEKIFGNIACEVGKVTKESKLIIKDGKKEIISNSIKELEKSYKETLKDY